MFVRSMCQKFNLRLIVLSKSCLGSKKEKGFYPLKNLKSKQTYES